MKEWRYSCTIFDLGTRWRWVVSFAPWSLFPREIVSSTHWIGDWVGLRASLDAMEMRKIFHCRESNSECPAYSPSLYRVSYPNAQGVHGLDLYGSSRTSGWILQLLQRLVKTWHKLHYVSSRKQCEDTSQPTPRYSINKEVPLTNVQCKRPITSQPGPQLHQTHNTIEESRQE
jgi:hypothetical protein